MDESPDYALRKKRKLKEPDDYLVMLLNDDWTSMEFVVEVLMSVFDKSAAEAERVMMDVHNSGRAAAGVYTADIAYTKAAQVHSMAAAREFPLKCIVERV